MTLVEVLVALGILVVGMIGVLSLVTAAVRAQKRAVDEASAAELAETVMADLRAKFETGSLPLGGMGAAEISHPHYPGYRYTVRLIPTDENRPADPRARGQAPPKAYFVEVEVIWAERGEKRSAAFRTFMILRTE
ncbi:MAG: hypothetical protein N3A38_00395 [Planctomycetota bacterium]|nr:hypothetical protein [Planctomycetota bacterium]